MANAEDILEFWFREAGPERWFKKSAEFDALCKSRFLTTLQAAARGECWEWRETPAGRSAEIIVLDQFSRNVYRDSAAAFAQDAMCLALAQEAVASGDHHKMTDDERYFTYMPYMHSESLRIHDEAIKLFEDLGRPEPVRYEHAHRAVIEQFGRYPGRNTALGRQSTAAEEKYLANEGGF